MELAIILITLVPIGAATLFYVSDQRAAADVDSDVETLPGQRVAREPFPEQRQGGASESVGEQQRDLSA